MNFTGMTVDQLRAELVRLGTSQEEANNIKGKANIVEKIEELSKESPDFDFSNVQMEQNSFVMENSNKEQPPQVGEDGWQDYVLGQLKEDERVEKNDSIYPKAAGLRRVIQKLIGPIVKSGPREVILSGGGATVVYEIEVVWAPDFPTGQWISEKDFIERAGNVRKFSEVAECSTANTPETFAKYPSATASSRAEGRCIKKALQLNVLTAEEMSSEIKEEVRDPSKITMTQIVGIKTLCERLKIDIDALILQELGPGVAIDDLSMDDGKNILSKIRQYQSNDNESLPIPEEIKCS